MEHHLFATTFLHSCDGPYNNQLHTIHPPLWTECSTRNILPIVLKHLLELSSHSSRIEQMEMASKVVSYVLHHRKVFFVPWTSSRDSQVGRRSRTISHKFWILLSTPNQFMSHSSLASSLDRHILPSSPSKSSTQRTILLDPNGEWDSRSIKIYQLHSILHKRSLPSTWDITQVPIEHNNFIYDTYEWVRNHADLSKPNHQLALLVAILFTRIGNQLGFKKDDTLNFKSLTIHPLNTAIRSLEWVPLSRRRYAANASLETTMLATYIIAFFKSISPLHIYLQQNNNRLGDRWTALHSEFVHASESFGHHHFH